MTPGESQQSRVCPGLHPRVGQNSQEKHCGPGGGRGRWEEGWQRAQRALPFNCVHFKGPFFSPLPVKNSSKIVLAVKLGADTEA